MLYDQIQQFCNKHGYRVGFGCHSDYIYIPFKRWFVAIEVDSYHWGLKLRLRSKQFNKVTKVLEDEEAENLFYEHQNQINTLAALLVGHWVVGLIDEEVER